MNFKFSETDMGYYIYITILDTIYTDTIFI